MTVKITQTGYTDVTLESAKVTYSLKKIPKIRHRGIKKSLWSADQASNPAKTEIIDYKKQRVDIIINGIFVNTPVTSARNLMSMCEAGGLKTLTWDSVLPATRTVTVITCEIDEEAGTTTNALPYRLVVTEGSEKS